MGCRVVFIDDFNDKNYVCDALINNIPGFDSNSFQKQSYTKLYLGTDYALLRKEFLDPKWRAVKKEKDSVFVSFGSSDSYDLALKTVEYLIRINPEFRISLLVGNNTRQLSELCDIKAVQIYSNISADKVAKLMSEAEICIVPASSLLNEVCSIGARAVVGYLADNQLIPYNYFVDNQMAAGVGDFFEMNFSMFKEKFNLAKNTNHFVANQHKRYKYQQVNNLKKIFASI